jgi:hypothetical protein
MFEHPPRCHHAREPPLPLISFVRPALPSGRAGCSLAPTETTVKHILLIVLMFAVGVVCSPFCMTSSEYR